ncbi:MAG: hypothetical protein ACI9H6_000183 [Patiriisocius sp.]|jgi:hypothetical protein
MGMLVQGKKHLFLGLLTFFICAVLTPVTAHGQVGTGAGPGGDGSGNGFGGGNDPGVINGVIIGTPTGGRGSETSTEPGSTGTATPAGTGGSGSGSVGTGSSAPVEPANVAARNDSGGVESLIYNVAVGLGGWIAGLGGTVFDLSMEKTVLKMGCWFVASGSGCNGADGNGAVGGVVNVLWSFVRDLFNILFIFALVFIGLRTILNSEDSGTQRALGLLIAAALLINFSLYISKVVVDVANFTAVEIYNQASAGIDDSYSLGAADGAARDTALVEFSTADRSIAGAYMQVLDISSWFAEIVEDRIIIYSILAMFFLIILGIVLLYGGLMLIVRFVAIIILLIFSPIMFLGWIFPGMASYSTKWRKMFVAYCFFAPAYIFMLYLGLYTLIQVKSGLNMQPFSTSFVSGGPPLSAGVFEVFLFYMIGLVFLYAATKVASVASDAGAGASMKWGDNMVRKATGGVTVGLAARGGRKTFGYAGQKIADNEKVKDYASRSAVGRGILRGSRAVGAASFDARGIGGVGKSLGLSEGKKGGYKAQRDEIVKKEQAFAKSLGSVGDDDQTVATMNEQKISLEADVVRLKTEKETTTDPTRKAMIVKGIAQREKDIKKKDEEIKREKNRRQIGSSGDITELAGATEKKEATRVELEDLRTKFTVAQESRDKTEMKALVTQIKAKKKEQKDLEKEIKSKTGSLGYAGALENRGFVTNTMWYGRITNQDREAGKEIRSQYEKAVKKSKDDERFDGLKEELSKKAA